MGRRSEARSMDGKKKVACAPKLVAEEVRSKDGKKK